MGKQIVRTQAISGSGLLSFIANAPIAIPASTFDPNRKRIRTKVFRRQNFAIIMVRAAITVPTEKQMRITSTPKAPA